MLAQGHDERVQILKRGAVTIKEDNDLHGWRRRGQFHRGQVFQVGIVHTTLRQIVIYQRLQSFPDLQAANQDMVANNQRRHGALILLGNPQLGLQPQEDKIAVYVAPDLNILVLNLIAILLVDNRQKLIHHIVTVRAGLSVEKHEASDRLARLPHGTLCSHCRKARCQEEYPKKCDRDPQRKHRPFFSHLPQTLHAIDLSNHPMIAQSSRFWGAVRPRGRGQSFLGWVRRSSGFLPP